MVLQTQSKPKPCLAISQHPASSLTMSSKECFSNCQWQHSRITCLCFMISCRKRWSGSWMLLHIHNYIYIYLYIYLCTVTHTVLQFTCLFAFWSFYIGVPGAGQFRKQAVVANANDSATLILASWCFGTPQLSTLQFYNLVENRGPNSNCFLSKKLLVTPLVWTLNKCKRLEKQHISYVFICIHMNHIYLIPIPSAPLLGRWMMQERGTKNAKLSIAIHLGAAPSAHHAASPKFWNGPSPYPPYLLVNVDIWLYKNTICW